MFLFIRVLNPFDTAHRTIIYGRRTARRPWHSASDRRPTKRRRGSIRPSRGAELARRGRYATGATDSVTGKMRWYGTWGDPGDDSRMTRLTHNVKFDSSGTSLQIICDQAQDGDVQGTSNQLQYIYNIIRESRIMQNQTIFEF